MYSPTQVGEQSSYGKMAIPGNWIRLGVVGWGLPHAPHVRVKLFCHRHGACLMPLMEFSGRKTQYDRRRF